MALPGVGAIASVFESTSSPALTGVGTLASGRPASLSDPQPVKIANAADAKKTKMNSRLVFTDAFLSPFLLLPTGHVFDSQYPCRPQNADGPYRREVQNKSPATLMAIGLHGVDEVMAVPYASKAESLERTSMFDAGIILKHQKRVNSATPNLLSRTSVLRCRAKHSAVPERNGTGTGPQRVCVVHRQPAAIRPANATRRRGFWLWVAPHPKARAFPETCWRGTYSTEPPPEPQRSAKGQQRSKREW